MSKNRKKTLVGTHLNSFFRYASAIHLGCAFIACTSRAPDVKTLHTELEKDSSLIDFIGPRLELLDSASGDLNRDAYRDFLLLLKDTNESQSAENVARPLLILLGTSKGFRLGALSSSAVYCYQCGGVMGDPFMGVQIDSSGTFSIGHYGGSNWRWTRNLTFQYDVKTSDWLLLRDVSESFNVFDENNVETEIRTAKDFGRKSFTTFNINQE